MSTRPNLTTDEVAKLLQHADLQSRVAFAMLVGEAGADEALLSALWMCQQLIDEGILDNPIHKAKALTEDAASAHVQRMKAGWETWTAVQDVLRRFRAGMAMTLTAESN